MYRCELWSCDKCEVVQLWSCDRCEVVKLWSCDRCEVVNCEVVTPRSWIRKWWSRLTAGEKPLPFLPGSSHEPSPLCYIDGQIPQPTIPLRNSRKKPSQKNMLMRTRALQGTNWSCLSYIAQWYHESNHGQNDALYSLTHKEDLFNGQLLLLYKFFHFVFAIPLVPNWDIFSGDDNSSYACVVAYN